MRYIVCIISHTYK